MTRNAFVLLVLFLFTCSASIHVYAAENSSFFRKVEVSGSDGDYLVKGEARPVTGEFFYVVEDGHHILIPETKVKSTKAYPKWSSFSIKLHIPKDMLPDNGTVTIYFCEKSHDEMIHVVPIVLQSFY